MESRAFGPYTIVEELGRGGQAVVYLAEDDKLHRKVALKVVAAPPGTISDDRRFLLSASDDYTVRLWDLTSHRLLQVYRCAEQALGAKFTSDGQHFYMNDGLHLTRSRITVDDRIDDPRELLRAAEAKAGVRLEGLELVPIE